MSKTFSKEEYAHHAVRIRRDLLAGLKHYQVELGISKGITRPSLSHAINDILEIGLITVRLRTNQIKEETCQSKTE